MKLYDGGVYLVNGYDIVEEGKMEQPVSREDAAKNTMAYGILESHNTSGNMQKLKIKFDKLTSHDITFVGISRNQAKHNNNSYASGTDFPGNLYEFANSGDTSMQSYKYDSKMTSFLGSVNYNYNDLYYAGVSYRRDGSSRMARENRYSCS